MFTAKRNLFVEFIDGLDKRIAVINEAFVSEPGSNDRKLQSISVC